MYYVGIDVSKRSVDVCLLAEGSKGSRKTKTLSNGQDSAQTLAKWLILQKCEISQTHVIMEATGIYHEYLSRGLYQMGILTSVINPCRSRAFAKAMGIFTKTDLVLCRYGSTSPTVVINVSLLTQGLRRELMIWHTGYLSLLVIVPSAT